MEAAQPAGSGGVRYARSAGSADVGSRVVVRRRLPDGQYGDLLGELLRFDAAGLAVRDRHGVRHEVAAADVLAAKSVPPAPARRGGGGGGGGGGGS